MKKLLVITGKSGSGKSTLVAELVKLFPDRFKKVVTYTSRPKRSTEVDGVDYHFLPTEFFINNSKLVLTKKTEEGFYYGTLRDDLFLSSHNLLLTSRITAVDKLIKIGIKNIVIVHISISDDLRIERMKLRGDSMESIESRIRDDSDNRNINFCEIPTIKLDAHRSIHQNAYRLSWMR